MDFYFSAAVPIEHHVMALEEIIKSSGETPEGNSFYYHESFVRCDEQIFKRANLFWAGSQCKRRLLEIGFNAGHSAMLLLLASGAPIDFTIFDLGAHAYTQPCMEYLKKQFSHVNFEYIEGDSTQTIPTFISNNMHKKRMYDVVHVDGGHEYNIVLHDVSNAMEFVALGGLLILDDTNIDYINKIADGVIKMGSFIEEKIIDTKRYKHRILRRIE